MRIQSVTSFHNFSALVLCSPPPDAQFDPFLQALLTVYDDPGYPVVPPNHLLPVICGPMNRPVDRKRQIESLLPDNHYHDQ